MKTLYEASNALEAHMLRNFLQQEGIATFVQGEHLQSGVGILPAGSFVRLVVDEADYAQARTAIDRWESASPSEPDEETHSEPHQTSTSFMNILIGLAMGLAFSYCLTLLFE